MANQDSGIPVTLQGASGNTYSFKAYPQNSSWAAVSGVYAILRQSSAGSVLYVGETENLANRMASHHRQACFDRNGWTHLAFLHESTTAGRKAIEKDVMDSYKPQCNREV